MGKATIIKCASCGKLLPREGKKYKSDGKFYCRNCMDQITIHKRLESDPVLSKLNGMNTRWTVCQLLSVVFTVLMMILMIICKGGVLDAFATISFFVFFALFVISSIVRNHYQKKILEIL